MKDESVGVVPVFISPSGEPLVCLVHHAVVSDAAGRASGGHWAFPKGHIDAGESKEAAARRELREETGIPTCKIDMSRTFVEYYSFEKDRIHFDKEVTYFVGFVDDMGVVGPIDVFKAEISEARWVSYEEAKELLSYPESIKIIDEVCVYLKNKGG